MSKIDEAIGIIKRVSNSNRKVILFFSTGKDSIALLDLMYPHFEEITCVYMFFFKDIIHIDNYLKWAQTKYPKIKILKVPHWNLTYILRTGTFCVPNPNVKLLKGTDIDNAIKVKTGIQYSFYGMKKADSLNRRVMLNTYENGQNNGKVYPLTDWTNKDVLAYMRQNKLPEPVRYSKNASGGLGFNKECYLWMRENSPEDLKSALKQFPMSMKILYDYDRNK